MEADLIAYILGDVTVGGLVGQRVRPGLRVQGEATPSITVTRISGGPEYADDGEVGLLNARVQVDCWATTYTGAKQLSGAVTDRLSAVQDVTQGATTFIYITLSDERDLSEVGANRAEYLHRVSLDFSVWSNFGDVEESESSTVGEPIGLLLTLTKAF